MAFPANFKKGKGKLAAKAKGKAVGKKGSLPPWLQKGKKSAKAEAKAEGESVAEAKKEKGACA